MLTRTAVALAFAILPAWCGDWNPKLAEQYLDSRQQAWVAWPHALESGVACVSCHTGLPYLLARPALRRTLGESGPTLYEGVLVASMRATVVRTDAKDLFRGLKGPIVDQVYGAQVVLSALVLAMDDAQRGRMSPEAEASFKRLWSTQVQAGDDKGAWHWSDFDLDPWETKDAAYYGGALGALATGIAPDGYQARPDIRENIAQLKTYLHDGLKTQPLHNRLFLLMASAKLRDLLPEADKQAILDEVWKKRDQAPPASGSNSYATAVVAYAVEQVGAGHSEAALARGLAWLKTHQDPASGRWSADSMNHPHDAGTMPALFMSDAATGYATAALLASERSAPHQHGRPTAKVSEVRAAPNP